jgi:hypothetical protein
MQKEEGHKNRSNSGIINTGQSEEEVISLETYSVLTTSKLP